MTDLFDDDDLFAPRPAPAPPAAPPPPKRRKPTVAERIVAKANAEAPIAVPAVELPQFLAGRRPASLACPCGAREEVKEPCPDALDCWRCHGLATMRRFEPRFPPPVNGGRALTPHERRGVELDQRLA